MNEKTRKEKIVKWLKTQWYLPQYNKASKIAKYYKWIIEDYEKRYDIETLRGRRKGIFEHAKMVLPYYEERAEKFSFKLKQIERR